MTDKHIPVAQVLDGAKSWAEVVVIGWDEDGDIQGASSTGRVAEILEMIETLKHKLLSGDYAP
jgi:hypothetical protein